MDILHLKGLQVLYSNSDDQTAQYLVDLALEEAQKGEGFKPDEFLTKNAQVKRKFFFFCVQDTK